MKDISKTEQKRKDSLENVIKSTPHFLASVVLSPIALPYAVLGAAFISASTTPDDGYSADCVEDFLENNPLISFWGKGFGNFGGAVKKYNSYHKR